jgi:hypothetical protein
MSLRHGKGKMRFQNSAFPICTIEGEFAHDAPSGLGRVEWADGTEMYGQFINGQLLNGKYFWAYKADCIYTQNQSKTVKRHITDDEVWTGKFERGKLYGYGKHESDTEIYEGEFSHGVPHGEGKLRFLGHEIFDHFEGTFE